jgi:ABC-type dipeptide/oligopeptide/nickel transport system permease subunit
VLATLVGMAVFAPAVAPYDPSKTSTAPLQTPSVAHLFGTDQLGRDTFSRVLYGGRVTLAVSFAAVLMSMLLGTALGLISGYLGGWVDGLIMRVMDGLMAFPGLILALTIAFALRPSLSSVIIALAVVRIPGFARLVRAQVLSLRTQEFILAAEVLGASQFRIILRHILPNLVSIILVQGSLSAGAVIFAEASLGFLGLSVPPPTPTWGRMLHDGYVYLEVNAWQSIMPGTVIFLAVLAFNFLGDGLRDALDPQQRRRRGV